MLCLAECSCRPITPLQGENLLIEKVNAATQTSAHRSAHPGNAGACTRTHLHTQAKLWPALVWVNVICTFSARAALAKASPLSLYSSLQHTNDLEFT